MFLKTITVSNHPYQSLWAQEYLQDSFEPNFKGLYLVVTLILLTLKSKVQNCPIHISSKIAQKYSRQTHNIGWFPVGYIKEGFAVRL